MKQKVMILICCMILSLNLAACSQNDIPRGRTEFPITYFTAYSTIIQTGDTAFLLVNGDSQNFRLWVDSCPIIKEIDSDISEKWDYKIVFCDTENIIESDSVYYIPHTAKSHVVYINESDNIIQFDNTSYSLNTSDTDSLSFYEGIRAFLITE